MSKRLSQRLFVQETAHIKNKLRLRALRLFLLGLQRRELRHGKEAGHKEHTEDNPQRAGADVLPGQLVGVVVEELGRENGNTARYDVSQTAHVVVAQSVGKEELAAVEHDGVVLDRLHESRNVATAQSSNTDGAETYAVIVRSANSPTGPETETRETVATGGHGSPANLVDRKMGRHHSSSSILFFNVATRLIPFRQLPTTDFSGTPLGWPSAQ